MKTLLIIGTFEALFLILLIISKREKGISDFFLGFIFLSFALSIGFTWLEIFNADNGYPFPWALNISWIFIFLHPLHPGWKGPEWSEPPISTGSGCRRNLKCGCHRKKINGTVPVPNRYSMQM
nr:hypothetical protein [Bacteroidales bacterium]